MEFIKITLMYKDREQGSYYDRIDNMDLADLIDGMEQGDDSYNLSIVEMSEVEYENLPEFQGF